MWGILYYIVNISLLKVTVLQKAKKKPKQKNTDIKDIETLYAEVT